MRLPGFASSKFQSTPSVWRETRKSLWILWTTLISIHSLRVEGDDFGAKKILDAYDFNPLPPCGGRLFRHRNLSLEYFISIHSLRVEGDRKLHRVHLG